MAVFVKLAGDIHFVQKAFFRNLIAFIISFAGILKDIKKNGRQAVAIPKGALLYLFLRAITGSIGVFGNFYAIDRIVLADAAILNKMAPFFAIIFSFLLIRDEKIKPVPFLCVTVAFLGSILIVKPSFNFTKMLPTFCAFMGGVGAGFAYACVRKLSYLKCNGKVIILFFSAFSMLLSVPYMIFNFNPMTWQQLLFLCGAGACAAGGQFSITAAYYFAPANKISIYDYTQIIFSTLFGLIFFGQLPDILSIIGYVIIISMALVNFLYSHKKQKILVSACLMGENCKYNGGNNYSEKLAEYIKSNDYEPVLVCPEVLGGLPVPRVPSEIVNGVITNREGIVVDKEFREGARIALETARQNKIKLAVLQSRSPSCGARQVYDGTFTGQLKQGQGVFAELLIKEGIQVIDVEDL